MKTCCQIALFFSVLLFPALFHAAQAPVGRSGEERCSSKPITVLPASLLERGNDMTDPQTPTTPKEIPPGNWGGQHISLEVTRAGGRVEYDCAHGTIDEKITLDRRGRFSVVGKHVEEHGGPVRQSEKSDGYAVLYVGQVNGDRMKLTVKRSDNKKVIGTFTLGRGQEPFIVKCR